MPGLKVKSDNLLKQKIDLQNKTKFFPQDG